MTVSSSVSKAGPFAGDGSNKNFSFGFKVFAATDIKVVLEDLVTLIQTELTYGTDYSVALVSGGIAGGDIVTTVAPSAEVALIIYRDMAYSQEIDIPVNGPFNADILEEGLDTAVMLIQQNLETLNRAILAPETSDIDPNAYYLDIIAAAETTSAAAASAAASALLAQNFYNAAIALGGISSIIHRSTVSRGDTNMTIPYLFTKGLIIVGGYVYDATDAAAITLTPSGANTIVTFAETIFGDHNVVVLILG